MTPLEKAKAAEGRVNYCDECGQFVIVGNGAFCKVDGKLIHPIMLVRGQGTGPAWNCKKRIKPITNYEKLIRKTPEELAGIMVSDCPPDYPHGDCREYEKNDGNLDCPKCWLDWLKQEAAE